MTGLRARSTWDCDTRVRGPRASRAGSILKLVAMHAEVEEGLARNLEPPGSRLPRAQIAVDDRLEPRDFG